MKCVDCGAPVDVGFWEGSGGQCVDCLCQNALPLTRIGEEQS